MEDGGSRIEDGGSRMDDGGWIRDGVRYAAGGAATYQLQLKIANLQLTISPVRFDVTNAERGTEDG